MARSKEVDGGLHLTVDEVRRARLRRLFTVTSETARGYVVQCLRLNWSGPVVVAKSREYVHPRAARRAGVRLVRAALGGAS